MNKAIVIMAAWLLGGVALGYLIGKTTNLRNNK